MADDTQVKMRLCAMAKTWADRVDEIATAEARLDALREQRDGLQRALCNMETQMMKIAETTRRDSWIIALEDDTLVQITSLVVRKVPFTGRDIVWP